MTIENGGQVARDRLAKTVNMKHGARFTGRDAQDVMDVIEQRDLLLIAAEESLKALGQYAGVDPANLDQYEQWFAGKHAKLYDAIATAKGKTDA